MKTTEDELYLIGLGLFIFGVPLTILYLNYGMSVISFPCYLYTTFGVYCPGCGGTRALIALCKGDVLQSIWYNPVVVYGLIIYFGFMLSHTLAKLPFLRVRGWKYHNWYWIVLVLLMLGDCILKNVLKFVFQITL